MRLLPLLHITTKNRHAIRCIPVRVAWFTKHKSKRGPAETLSYSISLRFTTDSEKVYVF